jgi:hypothetical protein
MHFGYQFAFSFKFSADFLSKIEHCYLYHRIANLSRVAPSRVVSKGDPSYAVTPGRALFGDGGTEVRIAPLHS